MLPALIKQFEQLIDLLHSKPHNISVFEVFFRTVRFHSIEIRDTLPGEVIGYFVAQGRFN